MNPPTLEDVIDMARSRRFSRPERMKIECGKILAVFNHAQHSETVIADAVTMSQHINLILLLSGPQLLDLLLKARAENDALAAEVAILRQLADERAARCAALEREAA